MKKKFLLLPLLMFLLVSCDPVIDPTDSATDPDPDEISEIDPTELNTAVGFDVYALLPPIYSNDYEVTVGTFPLYSTDVYVYLSDWTQQDAADYDDELLSLFTAGGKFNDYVIQENLYIVVDHNEEDVFYINLYAFAPRVEKLEIDSSIITELNSHFEKDVYSMLPKIYSNITQVFVKTAPKIIDVVVICWDWEEDDKEAYFTELGFTFNQWDANEMAYIIEENLYVGITRVNNFYYGVEVFSYIDGGEPTPKAEIDVATRTELNEYFDQDVYAMIPKIYSDDSDVTNWNKGSVIDVGVTCWDWRAPDAFAYEAALEDMLVYDDDEEAYILDEDLYVKVDKLVAGSYFVNVIYYGEPIEKLEISQVHIDEINHLAGADVYSIIPKIYSNGCSIFGEPGSGIDFFVFLNDWLGEDLLAYETALEESSLEFQYGYGYVLGEDLFMEVYSTGFGVSIHIYSDPDFSPYLQSEDWPADALNYFFGEELGATIPAFESDNEFTYIIMGEGGDAMLEITTECSDPEAYAIYLSALENAGWFVDDFLAKWGMYSADDAENKIHLELFESDGLIVWTFTLPAI